MSKAHLFLDNGVLKVTTEQIPEKPWPENAIEVGVACHKGIMDDYNSTLASIKQRATVVGNAEPLGDIKKFWRIRDLS
jgi:hypothetical protein